MLKDLVDEKYCVVPAKIQPSPHSPIQMPLIALEHPGVQADHADSEPAPGKWFLG